MLTEAGVRKLLQGGVHHGSDDRKKDIVLQNRDLTLHSRSQSRAVHRWSLISSLCVQKQKNCGLQAQTFKYVKHTRIYNNE